MNQQNAIAQAAPEVPPNEPIATQRLVEVVNFQPGPIYYLMLLLSLPTLIGPFILIVLQPGILNGKRAWKQQRKLQEVVPAFLAFIGGDPKWSNVTVTGTHGGRGLGANGIAYRDGMLFVMQDGVAAKLPWARIRSWTWRIDGYDTTTLYGAGMMDHLNNVRSNFQAQWRAEANSGFVISVRDVNRPEWQFRCSNETVLKRWMEILNQMNSGELARA